MKRNHSSESDNSNDAYQDILEHSRLPEPDTTNPKTDIPNQRRWSDSEIADIRQGCMTSPRMCASPSDSPEQCTQMIHVAALGVGRPGSRGELASSPRPGKRCRVKYTAPPGGGFVQCSRNPLPDDGEAELGDSDQAIALYRALEALGRCGPERDRAAASAGSAGAYGIPSETVQLRASVRDPLPDNVHLRAVRKALGLCRSEQEARDSEGEEAREWDEASEFGDSLASTTVGFSARNLATVAQTSGIVAQELQQLGAGTASGGCISWTNGDDGGDGGADEWHRGATVARRVARAARAAQLTASIGGGWT